MSSYLGFNGEELALFIELRDVFKLMNHKDPQNNFRREILLFEKVIKQLTKLFEANGNLNHMNRMVQDYQPNRYEEGGHFEK